MTIDNAQRFWLHRGVGSARRVLVHDEGDNVGPWKKDGNKGTFAITRDAAAAFTGPYGYSVKTDGAAAAIGDWCEGYRLLGYPVGTILVCRARLAVPNMAVSENVEMELEAVKGATSWRFGMQWVVSTGQGMYLKADASYAAVAAWDMVLVSQQYVSCELVVDLESGLYRRAMMNGVESDLGEVSGVKDTLSGWRGVRVLFRTTTDGASMSVLYVGEVYVGEYLDV